VVKFYILDGGISTIMAASFNIIYDEKLAGKIYSIKGFSSLFASFIVSYL
jgi:hypothetical protein